MNVLEFATAEAAKFGETLTADEASHVVWGFTGFPAFWSRLGPHEEGVTTVADCLGFELRVHFWDRAFRRWLGLPPPVDYCEEYERSFNAPTPGEPTGNPPSGGTGL